MAVFLVSVCFFLACSLSPYLVGASPEFKKNNPDIGKIEFARSYLSALSYIGRIQERWKKSSPKTAYAGDEIKVMRGYVAYLIKDNMDLRVAKGFLTKYLSAPNALIRKTADTFIASALTQMAINEKEKEIWDQWYAVKSNRKATRANETAFLNAQQELAFKRRDAYKGIIEATMLMTKTLKSEGNKNEGGLLLAVTTKQRESLLKTLDSFGRDTLDWGVKPGQDHMKASISVIRELLEDPLYTSRDE